VLRKPSPSIQQWQDCWCPNPKKINYKSKGSGHATRRDEKRRRKNHIERANNKKKN